MGLKQQIKYLYKCLVGKSIYLKIQTNKKYDYIGSSYGGFAVCLDELPQNPLVYSFGVGEDISFDLEIIKRINSTVYAFDPTPKAISYIQRQKLPDEFQFMDVAMSSIDGYLDFYLPKNPNFVSGSLEASNNISKQCIRVPSLRVKTIMEQKGHKYVDIIKMDIEGSEFDVIKDIIECNICFSQLCVETHARFLKDGKTKMKNMISILNHAGYRIFYVSDNGEELSFIKC